MEFNPSAPKEGINVSKRHPLKEATLLLAGLSLVLIAILFLVTKSVDWLVPWIPQKTEARVFNALPESLETLGIKIKDSPDQVLAKNLLDRLAAHWPDNPYTFRLLVYGGSDPNAMALPGGLIVVTTGLLEQVESENELALVLGHELGHFHNRDHLRRLGRSLVYGLVFATLTGGNGNLDPTSFAGDLTARGFDRKHEIDADHFGLSLVQAEYGHVAESWKFFERIQETQDESAISVYLSTHPASTDRIDGIRAYAREQGWPLEGALSNLRPSEED